MSPLFEALFSWAIVLSGYAAPAVQPQVVPVTHRWLEENACAGRKCKVWGWFPGKGSKVYVEDSLNAQDSLLASSVVVHEFVHYLQFSSGRWTYPYSCTDFIAMEREAYGVQQQYLVRYGVYQPIGGSMHGAGCIPTED